MFAHALPGVDQAARPASFQSRSRSSATPAPLRYLSQQAIIIGCLDAPPGGRVAGSCARSAGRRSRAGRKPQCHFQPTPSITAHCLAGPERHFLRGGRSSTDQPGNSYKRHARPHPDASTHDGLTRPRRRCGHRLFDIVSLTAMTAAANRSR